MDSLLHDARNPLNALAINLDVLTEKIRREHGEIPAAQEKNLRVMREQIFRVDGILKDFAEYMSHRRGADEPIDLSEFLAHVVGMLGHESRRQMIKVRHMAEPGLRIRGAVADVRLLLLQALYRAVARAGAEGEVDVTLQREGDQALLRIRDGGAPDAPEPFPHAERACSHIAASLGAQARVTGAETALVFPLC